MTCSCYLSASEAEHQFQASLDPGHDLWSQQAHSRCEIHLVDGQKLGHIDDRVSRKP